jgi:hypothetical protein
MANKTMTTGRYRDGVYASEAADNRQPLATRNFCDGMDGDDIDGEVEVRRGDDARGRMNEVLNENRGGGRGRR